MLSEEIRTAVDTVQAHVVGEMFSSSDLVVSEAAGLDSFLPGLAWLSYPVNFCLTAVAVLSVLVSLKYAVSISPYVFGGLFRWKHLANIANSIRLSRERDIMAVSLFLPMCLVISGMELYRPDFVGLVAPEWRTLAVSGCILLYIVVRGLIVLVAPAKRINHEAFRNANKSIRNFIIIAAIALVLIGLLYAYLVDSRAFLQNAALCLLAFVFFVFCARKFQFLASSCGQLKSFLYLCSLEILPAGILVLSAFIL